MVLCYKKLLISGFQWFYSYGAVNSCVAVGLNSSKKGKLKGATVNLYTFSLLHRMKKYTCLRRHPLYGENSTYFG